METEITFIVRPRMSGKTTDLLKWMEEAPEGEHRICVSHTSQRAMDVYRSTFNEEGPPAWAESWQFVGIGELEDGRIWGGVRRARGDKFVLGIDDLDMVLRQLMHFPVIIGLATMTGKLYDT